MCHLCCDSDENVVVAFGADNSSVSWEPLRAAFSSWLVNPYLSIFRVIPLDLFPLEGVFDDYFCVPRELAPEEVPGKPPKSAVI